jgi:3-hydroxyisobutyrate dehydrogenase
METRAPDARTLFVGLGRMGAPMVRRHCERFLTVVFDVNPETAARVAAETDTELLDDLAGVGRAGGPDVATVILMLPDSRTVEAVLGEDGSGLLGRLGAGAVVIDMGSSEPASTRSLAALAAERGVGYVDAPVSGGVSRAETGELAIMVGGRDEDVARARRHLEPLGASVVHVGPSGAGHAAKALNNLLSATNLAAAAEVLCVAQREGIHPGVMVGVLNSSTGRSHATEVKYPQYVLPGTFASGFAMDLMLKDLAIAEDLADEASAATPITRRTVQTLVEARRVLGRARMDHTEIVKYYEQVNHALLRSRDDSDSDTERNH